MNKILISIDRDDDARQMILKVDTINDAAYQKMRKKMKKWQKRYKLPKYSLTYQTNKTTAKGKPITGEIMDFQDFINAWEERGAELEITVESGDESDSEEEADNPVIQPPVSKVEEKQVEEDKPVHYEIKNPLIISISITQYKNKNVKAKLSGCKKNTQMMLNVFINKYKYSLKLAIHNYDKQNFSLNKADILDVFRKARDTIIKSTKDKSVSTIDGLIITLSGHGYGENIYCGDYDPDDEKESNKINANEIKDVFYGLHNQYKFPDMPKIMIIDSVPLEINEFENDDMKLDYNAVAAHKMQHWFCFFAGPIGYKNYGLHMANNRGGFLMNAIKSAFEADAKKQKGTLSGIQSRTRGNVFKLAGNKDKSIKTKLVIIHPEQKMDGSVKLIKLSPTPSGHVTFRPQRYIINPVIVNIGISEYDDAKYNNLEECGNDIVTMNELWKQYGYKNNAIVDNKEEPGLTAEEFWEKMADAKNLFTDEKENHDALIVSFSGHGDKESIWCGDYDGDENHVVLSELKKYFSHPNVRNKDDCPRIAIIDACRGSQDINKQYKGDETSTHPMQNWVTLYSNSSGYKSENTADGGILITCFRDILIDIDDEVGKKWDDIQKDIKSEVKDRSKQKQCCTPEGCFDDFNLFIKPKSRGKGPIWTNLKNVFRGN